MNRVPPQISHGTNTSAMNTISISSISGPFARVAAAARHIEAERPAGVAPLPGQRRGGEHPAELVERLHVRDGIGAW